MLTIIIARCLLVSKASNHCTVQSDDLELLVPPAVDQRILAGHGLLGGCPVGLVRING